jgi:hypothetical protein
MNVERQNWKRNWKSLFVCHISYGRLHTCCDTRSSNLMDGVLMGYLDSDNMSCEVKQRTGGKKNSIIFTNRGINNQLHKSHISANRSSWKIIWADAGLCNIRSCHTLSTVLPSWCRDAKCTDSCEFYAHQSVHRESVFKNVPTRWHFFLYSILFPVNGSTCFGWNIHPSSGDRINCSYSIW